MLSPFMLLGGSGGGGVGAAVVGGWMDGRAGGSWVGRWRNSEEDGPGWTLINPSRPIGGPQRRLQTLPGYK